MPPTVSCPRCQTPMDRAHYSTSDGGRIDVYECPDCAWTLDEDEVDL